MKRRIYALTKKRKEKLFSGYKLYIENIIKATGRNLSDYEFKGARIGILNSGVTTGIGHPILEGEPMNHWCRIPSLDFDKNSHVYLYCDNSGENFVIDVITKEKSPKLIDIRYYRIGG